MPFPLRPQEESSRLQLLLHLDAAYDLARWLTRDRDEAEDIVQEAYVRAFHYSAAYRGGNGRAWLLTIVRHCCYDFFRRNGMWDRIGPLDENRPPVATMTNDPETSLLEEERAELLRNALMELPPRYREILILRELEELSYNEIASIVGVPLGTVMSRLKRARDRLQRSLLGETRTERPTNIHSTECKGAI